MQLMLLNLAMKDLFQGNHSLSRRQATDILYSREGAFAKSLHRCSERFSRGNKTCLAISWRSSSANRGKRELFQGWNPEQNPCHRANPANPRDGKACTRTGRSCHQIACKIPLSSNEVSDSGETFTFIFHRNRNGEARELTKVFSDTSTGGGAERWRERCPKIPGNHTAPSAPTCSNICKRNQR